MGSNRLAPVLMAVGLAALAAAAILLVTRPPVSVEAPEISGFVVSEPRALPSFSLLDGKGQAFRSEDFAGAWSFVYFGYTYCPDVCPTSMVEMAGIARQLDTSGFDSEVNFYLVSVDPARDTPERVGEYAAYFNPRFRGLTGEKTEIDKLATAAGAIYEVPEAPEDDNYLVGHSSFITLLDPDGRVHAFFTMPLDGERIAKEFLEIVEEYGSSAARRPSG